MDNGFDSWGGYMDAKISKLEEQYEKTSGVFQKTNLFKGISIYVNGLTNPSADELKQIMMVHGGVYHHYLRSHTTFIIASNLPDVKIRNMNTSKVISAQWVVDCMKENRILDYTNYLLYTNQKISQPKIDFPKITRKSNEKSKSIDKKLEIIDDKLEQEEKKIEISPDVFDEDFVISSQTGANTQVLKSLRSSRLLNKRRKTASDLICSENEVISLTPSNRYSKKVKSSEKEALVSPLSNENSKNIETSNPILNESHILEEIFANDDNELFSLISDNSDCLLEATKESLKKDLNNTFCNKDDDDDNLMPWAVQENEQQNKNIGKETTTLFAKSAVDPKFLSEFYSNSRLHYISTLGLELKEYISELRDNHSGDFPKRNILREKLPIKFDYVKDTVTIMHIDMDCFFVSVGLRSHPELRGKPVAVTHSKSSGKTSSIRPGVDRQQEMNLYMKRLNEKFHDNVVSSKTDKVKNGFASNDSLSEIASCSYEARQMGVRNGMFVGQALKLCPDLKTIPYDFEGYKEVAYILYDTVAQYTLNIEAVSCDEMFVNLTDLLNDIRVDAMDFIQFIRNEVKSKTNCPCSAGVGGNRLQARMATKKAKPDGQFFLNPNCVLSYMESIPISDLPGVGHSTTVSLKNLGCETCRDLQKLSLAKLQCEFGKKFGETLYQFCRGIDNRPLSYGHIRKSVSAEVNYGIRFTEYAELETFLRQLCTEVHSRLTKIKRKGKCITLKVMIRSKEAPVESAKFMGHGFCDYLNKSTSLPDFTDNLDVITKSVLSIMKSINTPPNELRGIGIQITKLDLPARQETVMKTKNDIKTLFNKVAQKQNSLNKDTNKIDQKVIVASTNEFQQSNKEKSKTIPVTLTSPIKSPMKNIKSTIITKKSRDKSVKQKQSKTYDILNMFQKSAAVVANTSKKTCKTEEIPDGIDPSVLKELPDEIRQEIKRDYMKVKKVESNKEKNSTINNHSPAKSKICIDAEFLEVLPSQLRRDVEKEISLRDDKIIVLNRNESEALLKENNEVINTSNFNEENAVSNENIFTKVNWEDLIEGWVNSTDAPEYYDLQILKKHASELVVTRNIYVLYDPLVFLKRHVLQSSFLDPSYHA